MDIISCKSDTVSERPSLQHTVSRPTQGMPASGSRSKKRPLKAELGHLAV
jgi:hypothetical protein